MKKTIILYSAPLCGDCQALKAFMDANGVAYETRDIKQNPAYAEELETATGKQGVPYLIVDGEWVRGYELGAPFTEAFGRKILGL